jgi:hypothetical protein
MSQFSQWDIGACGCAPTCWPCKLPASGLHVTVSGHGIYALAFDGAHMWSTGCLSPGWYVGTDSRFVISCAPGCTFYAHYGHTPGGGCAAVVSRTSLENPSDCAGLNDNLLSFVRSACSPLSIVLTDGLLTYTITL